MTTNRARHVDFFARMSTSELSFASRKPSAIPISYTALFLPFSASVWLALLAVTALVWGALVLSRGGADPGGLLGVALVPLVKQCLTPSSMRANSHASRATAVLVYTWLIMSTVIGLAYSCNLLVVLTMKRSQRHSTLIY